MGGCAAKPKDAIGLKPDSESTPAENSSETTPAEAKTSDASTEDSKVAEVNDGDVKASEVKTDDVNADKESKPHNAEGTKAEEPLLVDLSSPKAQDAPSSSSHQAIEESNVAGDLLSELQSDIVLQPGSAIKTDPEESKAEASNPNAIPASSTQTSEVKDAAFGSLVEAVVANDKATTEKSADNVEQTSKVAAVASSVKEIVNEALGRQEETVENKPPGGTAPISTLPAEGNDSAVPPPAVANIDGKATGKENTAVRKVEPEAAGSDPYEGATTDAAARREEAAGEKQQIPGSSQLAPSIATSSLQTAEEKYAVAPPTAPS